MRYLKITSAKNPSDGIELNDFNGFLCTQFSTLGISRKFDTLAVGNRQFTVDNKPEFKKYNLTIEILTSYALYEAKYRELINFIDRYKKDGFRLYYRPYNGQPLRYCLCDIVTTAKTEKLQPVTLTVAQNSLWLGELKRETSVSVFDTNDNIFAFAEQGDDGYYSAKFYETEDIYYISFYTYEQSRVTFENASYNEIPLLIRIDGQCVNPFIQLYEINNVLPIRQLEIQTKIESGFYLEINSSINENGIWLVDKITGEKWDYSEYVNNEYGSPYFYISNGKYYINIQDQSQNAVLCDIFYNEEYSE